MTYKRRETNEFNPDWDAMAVLVEEQQRMAIELLRLREVNAELVETLQELSAWARAYPVTIFPEPDFDKAHKVLTENGMTLDAISASNMRHVITQVEKKVNTAIAKATGEQQ